MNTELERRKQEISRTQGRRKLWQRIVSALAAVVMFVTTYVLILPVEAQNRTFCEKEAHEHSAENGCYVETKTLKCDLKHEHTDECYITLLTLICQHEEHIHNKECYADKTADVETQQDWEASIKAAKLTGEWSKDIISIASTQLGYIESDKNYILGENNEIKGYTRYGDWIGDKYTDWSAAFVAFCLNYTGISKDEMTYDKVPEQWMELVKSAKQFNENITETNPGDIVFIDSDGDNKADRVGIVVEQSEDKIKTVEGDLNNSVAYFEYQLSAQTARANVEFSDENSNNSAAAGTPMGGNENINNKDFSEEKSTLGRTGREASQTLNIIGSVFLPKNPNYNPPIAITDPENTPEPTQAPENRVNPTTPPNNNKEATRSANIPTLQGPVTGPVAVLYEYAGGLQSENYYTTLAAAMNAIGTGTFEYTIVFTQDYASTAADWTAVTTKGGSAKMINFTSTYIEGGVQKGAFILSTDPTLHNGSFSHIYFNTDTTLFNITINYKSSVNIFARGHKLLIDTGVTCNRDIYSVQLWCGAYWGNMQGAVSEVTVLSGNWSTIWAGCNRGVYKGNSTIRIAGDAWVTKVILDGYRGTDSDTGLNATLVADGSEGAHFKELDVGYTTNTTGLTSSSNLNVTIIDMKDITDVDMVYARGDAGAPGGENRSTGKLTFKGDCQIRNALLTSFSIPIELAENAKLRLGSNSDESTPAQTNNDWLNAAGDKGALWAANGLVFNANSKLILGPGIGPNSLGGYYHHIFKSITVNGAGAEMDVFKSGSTAYPPLMRTSANMRGSYPLALGVYMDPNNAANQSVAMHDVLLRFETATNAVEANHLPGSVIDGANISALSGIHKSAGDIVPCVLLPDDGRLDVGLGRYEFDTVNGAQLYRVPINDKTVVTTNKPKALIAHDHSLKPSYTLFGRNYETYVDESVSLPVSSTQFYDDSRYAMFEYLYYGVGKITVTRNTTVELILDNVDMSGNFLMCFALSYSNTTLTLKDGSTNTLYTCNTTQINTPYATLHYVGGCIAKNGMSGSLHIQCQFMKNHPDGIEANGRVHQCSQNCGSLYCDAQAAAHTPAIGSFVRTAYPMADKVSKDTVSAGPGVVHNNYLYNNDPGFSNLYITGGNITVRASSHNAAIGSTCYAWYGRSNTSYSVTINGTTSTLCTGAGSPVAQGEMCKNLNISHARVKAYGGACAPGIGGGYGGLLDGLNISNGAYVLAQGGIHSPGIGTGSADSWSHPTQSQYTFHVRNITVSGGETVVEAIGGRGLHYPIIAHSVSTTVPGHYNMPGIGVGGDNNPLLTFAQRCTAGTLTNAYAAPESGYMAIIRDATAEAMQDINLGGLSDADREAALLEARSRSSFVQGAPSGSAIQINSARLQQPYTLIYFSKLEKVAIIDGVEQSGTAESPVIVPEGKEFTYKLRAGAIVDSAGAVQGSVVDVIPDGLEVIPGSQSPTTGWRGDGLTDSVTGRPLIAWDNQSFSDAQEFSVRVRVKPLGPNEYEKDIVNVATLYYVSSGNQIELPSNPTYHAVITHPENGFVKVNMAGQPVQGAGFTAYECTNTDAGHDHSAGCTYDASSPVGSEAFSGLTGIVGFTGLRVNRSYVIIETTTPPGYVVPAAGSYLVLTIASDGTQTITGFGDFSGQVVDDNGNYSVKNRLDTRTLVIEEEIVGGPDDKTFPFEVTITNGSGGRYVPPATSVRVVDANGDPVSVQIKIDANGKVTTQLGNGHKLIIDEIPINFIVTVNETTYYPYDVEISGDGTADANSPGITEPVTMDADKTIHYKNTLSAVDLTVKKTVQGGTTGMLFDFEIVAAGAGTLSAKLFDANGVEITTRTATITGTMVEVELGAGEYVVVSGVPVDSAVTVTEVNHPGYTVLIKDTTAGGVVLANGDSTTVTVSADLELEVINNAGFELPHTGGGGTLILTFSGAILMATALTYGMAVRRRRERREFSY